MNILSGFPQSSVDRTTLVPGPHDSFILKIPRDQVQWLQGGRQRGTEKTTAIDRVRILGKSTRSVPKHSTTCYVTALSKYCSLTHSVDNIVGMRPTGILDPSLRPGALAALPAEEEDQVPMTPHLPTGPAPPPSALLWVWNQEPNSPGTSKDRLAASRCKGNAGGAVGDVDKTVTVNICHQWCLP